MKRLLKPDETERGHYPPTTGVLEEGVDAGGS
jgi:hypothetical protein